MSKNNMFKKGMFIFVLIVLSSLFFSVKVNALDIKLEEAKVVETNMDIHDVVIENDIITNNFKFNNVDDYIILEFTVNNNENEPYTVKNLEDNNKNKNLSITYDYVKREIKAKEKYSFKVKMTYKNKLVNVEKIDIKDLVISLNLVKDNGQESKIVIVNPKTGDSILKYLILLLIALSGFILKQKKKKIYKALFIIPIILMPFVIFANERFKKDISFSDISIKGEMLPYEITIKVKGQDPITKIVRFGDEIGELPDVDVEGYTFDGWEDSKGNKVNNNTIVNGPIVINAKLIPIEYTISYDLNGGSVSNPTTYTIEDEITLNNPTKKGYNFSGWTGSNGDVLQTEVTIINSTGNLNYEAHYSVKDDTSYKVIHRKQKLDLTGYEVVDTDNLTGVTNTTVRPQTKDYTGFTSPEERELTITADGEATLTYDYNRIIYTVDLDHIENTTSNLPSGDYPYGTKVTLTPNTKPGYTFDGWNDGNEDNPRQIIIDGESINIKPVYKPNTNTPYKVIHRIQRVDKSYEEQVDNLTGTTDTEVTPGVKHLDNFIIPTPVTITIKGDGTSTVTYTYDRVLYNFSLSDDNTIASLPEGEYPYETEITITPKEKPGYTFDKWSDGNTDNPRTIVLTEDISIKPIYKANTNTAYKVIHKYQKIDLISYEEEAENKEGTTDETITPSIKSKTGFKNPELQTTTIKADGSTVVTYIYEREMYTYSIEDDNVISSIPEGEYPYETEITISPKEKPGYTFDKWNDGDKTNPRTITLSEDISIKPIYKANTDTAYTVNHYKQNITLAGYELADTDTLTGTTDTEVTPDVKSYTGFTAPSTQTVTISGDGRTVVNYNYTRNKYTYSITDEEDVISSKPEGEYPYGTEVTIEAKDKPGYDFEGWSDGNTDNPRTITINDDTEINPVYTTKKNTAYKVIHKTMKLDGETYKVEEEELKTGETGKEVTPAVKTYTGFTSPETQTVKIKGDGTTEVIYKYTRNKYSFSISDRTNIDETSTPDGEYYYETEITLKAKEKTGYTFSKWSNNDTNNPTTFTLENNTEIEPIYEANKYNIVFNSNGGTGTMSDEEMTYDTEKALTKNTFIKEGYTFDSWNTKADGSGTKYTNEESVKNLATSGNKILYAIWKANDDTAYKVIHKYQKIDLISYEEEVENKEGTTDETITPSIKSKTGFKNPELQTTTIKADGSTVVTYIYEREMYTYSIEDDNVISSIPEGEYPYETEITITPKEKPGYTFDKWNDGDKTNPRTIILSEDISIKPIYKANTDTAYTVNHYKQNITLAGYELADTDTLTGTTDTEVTPDVKSYTGFTAPSTQTVTISGDGRTVVNYNYTRNIYTYTIGDSEDVISSLPEGEYPYGTEVTIEAKEKVGYEFEGWSDGNTDNPRTITINDDTEINPVYTTKKNTAYKVIHKTMKLDGETYKVEEEELKTGETGTYVTPAVKTYTGFTSPELKTEKIKADGSLEIEYLYTRNKYSFSISDRTNIDETSTRDGEYYYETEITLKAKEKTGYTFSKWSNNDTNNPTTLTLENNTEIEPEYEANKYNVVFNSNGGTGNMSDEEMTYDQEKKISKNTFIKEGYTFDKWNTKADGTGTSYRDEEEVENLATSGNKILYAIWKANDDTAYKVVHKYQNVDLTSYTEEVENKTGTTDTLVSPEVKGKTGFISPQVVAELIKPDGSTVITYIYERIKYTFTLTNSSDVISSVDSGEYPYETEITIEAKEKVGYHFLNWNGDISTNPYTFNLTENKEFTLNYEPNNYTIIFNSNTGTGSMNNQVMTYDIEDSLYNNSFNKTGYTFDKWNTASNGTGTDYTDGQSVKNLVPTGSINLYAIWSANELVFNGDETISKIYSNSSQTITIEGASNGTGNYSYTEVSEKNKSGIDTNYITIDNTTIRLSNNIPVGEYTYVVNASDTVSGSNKNATYKITITKQKSDSVTNMSVNPNGQVSFTNSSNADGYLISIDGINYTPIIPGDETTTYDYLNVITATSGTRTVYVKATNSDGDNYEESDPVTKDVTVYTLSTSVNNTDYGTISKSSTNVISGVTYSTSETTLTLSDSRTVTTAKKDITGYTTTFTGWSSSTGTISQDTSISANYERTINKYTLTIISNGGTFTETEGWTISGDTATKEYDYNTSISSFPEIYKSGYVLAGYNTKQDGTGDIITTESSITNATTIYPQWVVAVAMFDTGKNVNAKMKRLAGNTEVTEYSSDSNITSIQKSSIKPDISSMTSDNIVSISNTTYNTPIYMWYDNGTIYWWSEDNDPSLNQDSSAMFSSLRNVENIDLNSFNTNNVTNMQFMFGSCESLTSLDLGENFNTSSITNMAAMFSECRNLTSLDLGDNFDTSNVTNMQNMFNGCRSLTSLDLGDEFNTGNVTDMSGMFNYCKFLVTLDLGSSFDTAAVTNMSSMFNECYNLTNLNLGNNFDTSNVTSMNNMFARCSSLTSLDLGDKFDTKNVTSMTSMFTNCSSLTSLDLGDKFDTSNVTSTSNMFTSCTNLANLDLGDKFDTKNVWDMRYMFSRCSNLRSLDLGDKFDTSKVTNMTSMFNECSNLTTLDLGDKFDTKNVTSMFELFNGCSNLTSLDLGDSFDTSKVTSMQFMFRYCSKLTSLDLGDKFDTKNVTSMLYMFSGCSRLTNLDLGDKFDTSKVGSTQDMFSYCNNLTNLNLGDKFDTSNVTNMGAMFFNCRSLTIIDLGENFDTSNVIKIGQMFYDCRNLTTIYVPDSFVTTSATSSNDMFYNDTRLVGGMGTTFSSSHTDKEYAHIDGGTNNPGYFTDRNALNVIYDANGGTGSMNTQIGTYNTDVTLSTNTFTRSGYIFAGWNTKADGTGTPYVDEATIKIKSNMTLYAQWIELMAMFDTGQNVKDKMRVLAGSNSSEYYYGDTNITSIQKSNTKPDISTMTSDNIVSISNDIYNVPIYMWFDNGTMYWWSEDNTPNLNQDSSNMFKELRSVENIDLNHFDTSSVTNMEYMFSSCTSLTSLDLGNNFDTSNVTNMKNMFFNSYSLTSLDLGDKFDTSNVTNMYSMFSQVGPITNLDLGDKFDTSNVTTMRGMFGSSKIVIIDLGDKFDTSNVTDMGFMFDYCGSLTNLDLGDKFDTSNVTEMQEMFQGCRSLASLDLGDKFDTSNVTNMSIMFGSCTNLTSLDLGDNFDTSNVTKMSGMFGSCTNLTNLDLGDKFDTSNVTTMYGMFGSCTNLTNLDLGDKFDTSNVTSMYGMFKDCSSLTSLDLGDNFNTNKVTNMQNMFMGCSSLTSLDLGDNFDTSNVTNMEKMFLNCTNLVSLDLGNKFDTSKVTSMSDMFSNCSSLTNLDLGENYDTRNVTNMYGMFKNCTNLTTIYATSAFNTNLVDYSNSYDVFSGDTNLVGGMGTTYSSSHTDKEYAHIDGGTSNPGYFTDKNNFVKIKYNANGGTGTMSNQMVTKNVATPLNINTFTRSGYMFNNWNTAPDGTGTSYSDGGTITLNSSVTLYAQWTKLEAMFDTGRNVNTKMKKLADSYVNTWEDGTKKITSIQKSTTMPDISSMTNDNIVSNSSSSSAPIYIWYDTGTIYWWSEDIDPSFDQDSSYMFNGIYELTTLDLSVFDTSNVTNMEGMFQNCFSMPSINLTNFDTSNVTNMSNMFNNCNSLTSLDLSGFNTSQVTNMSGMFSGCDSITNINLGNNFNTSQVTDMSRMFKGCKNLIGLDLSGFNTSKVTDMSNMFESCKNLISLDLNSFNTSQVTNMSEMFYYCESITNINLGNNFNTSNVTDMTFMFSSCTSLITIDLGSNFDTSNVSKIYNMFSHCNNLTTIYVSADLITTNITNSSNMFTNDTNLVGGSGTAYDSSHNDKTYARIDGGTNNPGYFTYKAPSTGASISKVIGKFGSNIVFRRPILLISILVTIIILLLIFIFRKKKRT